MNARRLDNFFALLLLGTALTYGIGESGATGSGVIMVVLGIAAAKGYWIAREFMGLNQVRWLWSGLVVGWLLVVLAIIAGSYWLGGG